MKQWPSCGHERVYALGDGRFKCRACGRRYSPSTAWGVSRLPEAVKTRLLRGFAQGRSAYREQQANGASPAAVDRFYRVLRACCAKGEGLLRPFTARAGAFVFGFSVREGKVRVAELRGSALARAKQRTAQPSRIYAENGRVYGIFRIRGQHVLFREAINAADTCPTEGVIAEFLSFARSRLDTLRTLPRRQFHLHAGEICCRFNHRGEDLCALLRHALETTPRADLTAILGDAARPSRLLG